MTEELFDLSAEYEHMLRKGVDLTGEDPSYFLRGRVAEVKRRMPSACSVRRILDFGCGTGETSAHLAKVFSGAEVFGVDTSENAVRTAETRHGSARVRFGTLDRLAESERFNLCYVNGVFHHIEPADRLSAVTAIRNSLMPGGYFTLWENNPWNPGTRMVMSRIPFDRNAKTLTYIEAQRLVLAAGFELDVPTRFLFYFPKALGFLRGTERFFARVPLGGQYCVVARIP
ncbi:MAG: class I SAM-dependent methyltransferase [Candidatus Solibacter sp.]